MDAHIFTLFHVALSLVGIFSGLIVAYGLVTDQRMSFPTAIFLLTTIAISVTGFMFHRDHIFPGYILGVLSLLLAASYGLYLQNLRGIWRAVYIMGAVTGLYFNVFVLIVQAFLKISALHALVPTQSTEPAFAGAQGLALLLFIVIGIVAFRRFRPVIFS